MLFVCSFYWGNVGNKSLESVRFCDCWLGNPGGKRVSINDVDKKLSFCNSPNVLETKFKILLYQLFTICGQSLF